MLRPVILAVLAGLLMYGLACRPMGHPPADRPPAPARPAPPPSGKPPIQATLSPSAQRGFDLWRGEGACIGCHFIEGVGGGTSGPPLTDIGSTAEQRIPGMSARDYLRQSILDPQAYVVPGYQPIMPSYRERLSEEQVEQLVDFYLALKRQ